MSSHPTVPESCPDPELLAAFAFKALAGSRREAVESHLSRCPDCRVVVGASVKPAEPARLQGVRLHWARIKWGAAAAAALLAMSGGIAHWKWGTGPGTASPIPASNEPRPPVWAMDGALSTGPAESRAVSLPEGTVLSLAPGTRISPAAPQQGERWHFRLEAGGLEVATAPGGGTARVSSPAGSIRILGTRFKTRAFALRGFPRAQEVLAVDLDEGRVELETAAGVAPLRPGMRGLAFAGEPPSQQERGQEQAKALADLAASLRPPAERTDAGWILPGAEAGARLRAATLWISGPKDAKDWREALRTSADPREREAIAALIRICASDEEWDETVH